MSRPCARENLYIGHRHLSDERRGVLDDNAKEIAARIDELEENLIKNKWRGNFFLLKKKIFWGRIFISPIACLIALTPLIAWSANFLGQEIWIVWVGLAVITAIRSLDGAEIYKEESAKWNHEHETDITKRLSRSLYSFDFGHLPGVDEERARTISDLIWSADSQTADLTINAINNLRNQYGSDQGGAKISSTIPLAFVHKYWLNVVGIGAEKGMNPLSLAISALDIDKAKELINQGDRLDFLIRPYDRAIPVTALWIACDASVAARAKAKEEDIPTELAREMLLEQRIAMFEWVLSCNPILWVESARDDVSLAELGAWNHAHFKEIATSFTKRVELEKYLTCNQVPRQETNDDRRVRM